MSCSGYCFNTNSKIGCENEFALFITCKEDSDLYLANLDRYIDFEKQGDMYKISLSKLSKLLENKLDDIESIEVYYNELEMAVDTCGLPCVIKSLY